MSSQKMIGIFLFLVLFVLFCLLISGKSLWRDNRQKWWVEIETEQPQCTYYFGPFDTVQESVANQAGYIEDLQGEKAKVVAVHVKQCQPQKLTHCEETALG